MTAEVNVSSIYQERGMISNSIYNPIHKKAKRVSEFPQYSCPGVPLCICLCPSGQAAPPSCIETWHKGTAAK